jgi:hypothetical protein
VLLKVAQELQNQAVNQDLVKRIDPRLGQKDQVTVMHLLSAVLNALKVRTDVQADLVVIAAKEELLQNVPTPNVAMTEENQETDVHQLAHTANVQKAEVMTDAQADLVAKVATDVHQLAHTANVQKAEVMTDAQADLAAKVATDAHLLALMASVQRAEVMTDVQADLAVIEAIEDHQPVVVATIGAAALIEKKITTANQRVQPENLVVRTWLKELKLAI